MNTKLNVTELVPNMVDTAKHHIDSGNGPGFVLCAKLRISAKVTTGFGL